MMSSQSSISTVVTAVAFTTFNEQRRAHEIESNAIKEALAAVDKVRYDSILNQISAAQVPVAAADQVFFTETGAALEQLAQRAAAEEASWKVHLDAYVAARAISGTLVYLPAPLDVLGVHYWINDDNIPVQLTGTSLTEINKNRDKSLFAVRGMTPQMRAKVVGPDYRLRKEVMKSTLTEGYAAIKFSGLHSSGATYSLKVGAPRDTQRSIAALLKLADCPVCLNDDLFDFWDGAVQFNEFKTTFLDFKKITSIKDCEKISVMREAGAAMIEFMAAVFGPHWRSPWGTSIMQVLNDDHLEEVTRAAPLFVVRALTRVLASTWNKLRSQFLVGGVVQDLSHGQWLPDWQTELEETMHVEPFTIATFKTEMEQEMRDQLRVRCAASARTVRALPTEDSGSDADKPKKKKAKKASSSTAAAVQVPRQKAVHPATVAAAKAAALNVCFGELATYCSFAGHDPCDYGATCTFSHDFSTLSLTEVKGLIKKSYKRSMLQPGLKDEFVQAAVASGKF